MTFADKCRQAGINYKTASVYKYKHPELTEEQVIEYYMNKKDLKEVHVGETIQSKYGMKLTIIAYRQYNDIDVQFEDGYTVQHANYSSFIHDKIINKNIAENPAQVKNLNSINDRLGQQVKARNGQLMKIIAYRNSKDIDVQFEDGTIVKNKSYSNFLIGNIRNINIFSRDKENNSRWSDRTGETAISTKGQKMTIIRYNGNADIDVQFEDGTIVKNKSYINFISGHIENPNNAVRIKASDKIGLTNMANNGMLMKIIDVQGRNIIVEFEDGTQVKTSFHAFKNGAVSSKSQREKELKLEKQSRLHVGEEWRDKNGEKIVIIKRNGKDSYTAVYEDGQEIDSSYNKISHGLVSKQNVNSYKKLKSICEKYNIDYNKALVFKRYHKLSIEKTIVHYIPDAYINIFGELIIPDTSTKEV